MAQNTGKVVTRARMINLKQRVVSGQPLNGDVHVEGMTVRYKNGYPDSFEEQPSVAAWDGHWEFHRNGNLHRIGGPAVIDEWGAWMECWINGELQSIGQCIFTVISKR